MSGTIYKRPDDISWFNHNCDPAVIGEARAIMDDTKRSMTITHGELCELASYSGLEPNFGEELSPMDRLCLSRRVARQQEHGVGPWRSEPIINAHSEQIRECEDGPGHGTGAVRALIVAVAMVVVVVLIAVWMGGRL